MYSAVVAMRSMYSAVVTVRSLFSRKLPSGRDCLYLTVPKHVGKVTSMFPNSTLMKKQYNAVSIEEKLAVINWLGKD
jgi:hypothetical protein